MFGDDTRKATFVAFWRCGIIDDVELASCQETLSKWVTHKVVLCSAHFSVTIVRLLFDFTKDVLSSVGLCASVTVVQQNSPVAWSGPVRDKVYFRESRRRKQHVYLKLNDTSSQIALYECFIFPTQCWTQRVYWRVDSGIDHFRFYLWIWKGFKECIALLMSIDNTKCVIKYFVSCAQYMMQIL